jgi:hypothetical protein
MMAQNLSLICLSLGLGLALSQLPRTNTLPLGSDPIHASSVPIAAAQSISQDTLARRSARPALAKDFCQATGQVSGYVRVVNAVLVGIHVARGITQVRRMPQ